MSAFFFYYFSAVVILSSLLTVTLRNPVHCGLALLAMLLHMAGFFVLLNAEFLAAVQVIVYAGAILVLYLFVVMLLNIKTDERYLHHRFAIGIFLILAICGEVFLLLMTSPFAGRPGEATVEKVLSVGQSYAIGITLFNDYLLPFEIIGVFLLGAIIGAIVLTKTSAPVKKQ
ncbi:MAG TPA: NADH-quinone oxidoreductase subunit J [Nitrospiria bacterium]|nr:NADH-quinone oxidoreductase subunit J [Nitrospiria bacterium]